MSGEDIYGDYTGPPLLQLSMTATSVRNAMNSTEVDPPPMRALTTSFETGIRRFYNREDCDRCSNHGERMGRWKRLRIGMSGSVTRRGPSGTASLHHCGVVACLGHRCESSGWMGRGRRQRPPGRQNKRESNCRKIFFERYMVRLQSEIRKVGNMMSRILQNQEIDRARDNEMNMFSILPKGSAGAAEIREHILQR